MERKILLLILLFNVSCKEMKQGVDNWAKTNSLKGSQGGQTESNTKFTSVCPRGSIADQKLSTESKKMCRTKSGAIFAASDAFQEYYPNGNPKTMLVYTGDNLLKIHWYENGRQKEEIQYKNNKKEGVYKAWHEEGAIKEIASYTSGNLNGLYKKYHTNGKIKEKSIYALDQKNGISENFNEDGKLISKETYKNNQKNGNAEYINAEVARITSHGAYADNKYSGRWVNYNINGTPSSYGSYEKGKKNGEWKYFDENGKPQQTEYFQNGELTKKLELKASVSFKNEDQLGAKPPEYSSKNRLKNSIQPTPAVQEKTGWQPL